ncbi:MAG: type II secretion system F family protein [Clostridiaceae bacterium]|nr:type II secretion system F family protein [Clostridiaceae bacterium]
MASFNYECINRQGQLIKGQINAESISEAIDKLKSTGLSIVDLKEFKEKKKFNFLSTKKKVTIGELALFSRQLSAMISAGIPITRALSTLSRQVENTTLKFALDDISRNVEGGMSLTDAFGSYPQIFNDLYIAMINAGEVGGMLETSLLRLSDQLQKEKVLRDEIKSAISYPRSIGIFAVLIFVAMMAFLVPVFEGFLPKTDHIPALTQFVFNCSRSLRERYYLWLLAVCLIIAAIVLFMKSKKGHDIWENLKIKMPIFGPVIFKSVIARFTRTLSTLLDGGIPVVQALESAGPTSGSDIVSNTVKLASKRIEEGKSIASTLQESGVFPPMVTHMIAVGEETGTLPQLLNKLAEFYEQEVETSTKGLQSLIQPIALIIIGILIGGMLISLYLPIFSSVSSGGLF